MKIVHALGWYYPDSLGGTEVYVAGLCRRFKSSGHETLVAAPQAGLQTVREYQHEHVPVFRYPVPAQPSRSEAQGTMPARGAEQFHAWLRRVRPDVLHLHSMVTGLGLHEIRVARELSIPVVLTHHLPSLGAVCRQGALMERGVDVCDGVAEITRCASCLLQVRGLPQPLAEGFARLPQGLSAAFGRIPGRVGTAVGMVASIADDRLRCAELNAIVGAQVVLNETGRRILVANGASPDRIVVNRLGIDQAIPSAVVSRRGPTPQPVRFGYVGRIDAAKGIRELMLAVQSLPTDLPLSLEIVGPIQSAVPPGFGIAVTQLAHSEARIRLTPAVASAEVPSVLARFDILCCPSTGFENGPTVALEAMAVGTPILASRVGNLSEIVTDGIDGRLVAPGDIRALAAAIEEIARFPQATADRWRRALGPVRTLNHVAQDYLALYARLLPPAARAC